MNSIFITGSNRGLGLGIVKYLAKQISRPPKHIFATCRDIEKATDLRQLADEHPNIHIIELDVGDSRSHEKAVAYVKEIVAENGLNVLFNNAGVGGKSVRLPAVKEEDILKTFSINTVTPVMLSKAMYPLLKTAATANKSESMGVGKAAIINVSSILGSIGSNGEGAMYAYRMSKSAINAATKSMSVDFQQLQILCVAMHPGWVKTDMGGKNAPLEIEPACAQIVETVLKLNETHNGCFIGPDGKTLPW